MAWAQRLSGIGMALILWAVVPGFAATPAPTTVAIDINAGVFAWDWTKGDGGDVREFRMYCGKTSGQYTKQTVLPNPNARSMPVKDAIDGVGLWFCAVSAANTAGESAKSNEVSFEANAIPIGPVNLRLQSR